MTEIADDEIAALFSGNFARLNADGAREIIPIDKMMNPAPPEDIRRTDTHEYLFGYEVYAYAYWENGQFPDRNDARFASHWSTPTGQFTRLFAEMQLRDAVLSERERCLACQPSTAESPNENAYQRGRFDGIMEFARAIAHPTPSSPSEMEQRA